MLEILNVSKSFPGVKALSEVSIHFKRGEVHALLGENGAGKSTLIKILSGLHKPDAASQIILDDELYSPLNPFDALSKGIQTVYQNLSVLENASIAENIMLEKLPRISKHGIVDWKYINSEAARYLQSVGLAVNPKKMISELSVAQQQLVEIAKAVVSNVKIVLLDEPTASLTNEETRHLFSIVEKLKSEGALIIFVSHHLEEVLEIADRISILRDGELVITDDRKNFDVKTIVSYMIGRDISEKKYQKNKLDTNQNVLEVRNLKAENLAYDINFELHKGEILGFYGLVGSGRSELAKIIIGHEQYDEGEILINNVPVKIKSIRHALEKYQIGYVTEHRRKDGLILSENIKTNTTMTIWKKISKLFGYISSTTEVDIATKIVNELDIKATSIRQKVANLSGGNQQKVNVGKWLAAETEILIIDEPTVGVDVGAKEYFEELIIELSRKKKSIILISSDMPEIIRLSHRILVFSKNRIVGEVDNYESDYEKTSKNISRYISEFSGGISDVDVGQVS